MLKNIFICLVVMIILNNVIADEEVKKETVPMPEGFEGIYLGMSIEELFKIRPRVTIDSVTAMHIGSLDQKIDTTKPNQTLEESSESDSVFGLNMLAMYPFRDGKLKSALIGWTGDINHIKKHHKAFVSSCIKRWGSDYQKKILKQE